MSSGNLFRPYKSGKAQQTYVLQGWNWVQTHVDRRLSLTKICDSYFIVLNQLSICRSTLMCDLFKSLTMYVFLFFCGSVFLFMCLSLFVLAFTHSSKNLTWRDMQHLVVRTSHPAHLLTNDWRTNGVGRKGTAAPSEFSPALCSLQALWKSFTCYASGKIHCKWRCEALEYVVWKSWITCTLQLVDVISYSWEGKHSCVCFLFLLLVSAVSHSYGYGLLDASAIVALAETWTNVRPQRKCVITMVSEPR